MIDFKHVTKIYDQHKVLNNLSLTIAKHELFVLVGPSGSGKTTLLKMVNRLNTPTSGEIIVNGQRVSQIDDVQQFRRHIGYVLQAGALFPNLNVTENAAIQLESLHWPPQKQHQRIAELLQQVGLEPKAFMQRYPHELSGGEAQRIGIVRALAAKPDIILMDEPFSALDPLSREQLQALVLQLHQQLQMTIIFVTHDMEEAVKLADRLAVIYQGELQQVGTPDEILAQPVNSFVHDFFQSLERKQLYLQQVLAAGWGTPPETGTELEFAPTKTVADWAQLLAEHPYQNIKVNNLILKPQDLLQYVAHLKPGRK